ncbi:hypothetical protein CP157_03658 (plasmid) [Paracoccus marcusii]|nr:hypothetical protein CP157_03658 [Paracoccus marcusii]
MVNDALASLTAEFEALYFNFGHPSIAPERLIRGILIQILFSIRSERQLMEQMQYNLMFRWFVGLGIDDPVWVPTMSTKSRDRLLTTEMSRKVMAAILAHREVAPLLSDEHFSVDGTLVKAWASMKSFQSKAESALSKDEGPDDPLRYDIVADQPVQPQPQPELEPNLMPRATSTAMPRSISGARSVRTPRLSRPPIIRLGSTRNRQAPGRCYALWGMRRWRAARA